MNQIEQWVNGAANGDLQAQEELARYLMPKALRLAQRRHAKLSPSDDYEDIAISAVVSLCQRIHNGEQIFTSENEFLALLKKFVMGKIRTRTRYHFAARRDVSMTTSIPTSSDPEQTHFSEPLLEPQLIKQTPEIWIDDLTQNLDAEEKTFLSQLLSDVEYELQGLFSLLFNKLDPKPRQVLQLLTSKKMTQLEIARELDIATVSVERYVQIIKSEIRALIQ